MWERIAIAILIELIKRRVNETEQREIIEIAKKASGPEDVVRRIIEHPTLCLKTIRVLTDAVEDLLKKID